MKPTNEPLICPYTGLRSFTEEESLYFKGRDEQIDQVARLLEHNKFLMLTGASGEGKSSLIYAGLIPNARAGFFKAKYTNWVVTDFRPERSPVKNMAVAVAETFGAQPATIETELRRGFSSLIDLYVNSSFYTEENDETWKALNDDQRRSKTRSAANLLIIVDQFEEFFTNPENYSSSAPSQDSQIVVNLALETARIALQRNLPVYLVCTMRSDYIGQCSAFRGLPEYIGFSQFFVPRLKRQEIKQVIEEPAILSGNRITRRLVERLVYDLADGIDQLPILQHALRQVWLAASEGQEEMDLLHYAMVGGMPVNELPETDQPRYASWYAHLPENQKRFYEDPGLNKIIEIHANRLYEGAWVYYNESNTRHPITQKDAKRIIALTFACLTKIDDSRAVRNRMTLLEITNIINQPNLTTEVVAGVINLFRESSNSFIRPYKTEEAGTHSLTPETVLDITHESLIRNWAMLNKWANQEFEFYSTFVDFKKQLARWKSSNESASFLLPLGPLTFFENWFNACRPNAWWIDRYSERKLDPAQSLQHSESVLADTKAFIKRSANKVWLTRAFMKYGAQSITIVFALSAMLVLTGFYWYDAQRKTNKSVEAEVIEKAHGLLQSKEVNQLNKATYLLLEERMKKGSLLPYLAGLPNKKERTELTLAAYRLILYFDKHSSMRLKTELVDRTLLEFQQYDRPSNEQAEFQLEEQNQFLLLLAYDNYYNPSAKIETVIMPAVAASQYQLINHFFSSTARYKGNIPTELNLAIQLWLTFGNPSAARISSLLAVVSPLYDSAARRVFDRYYVRGNYESNGRIPSDYNGGYHTLASLYAATGDVENIIRCFQHLPETYFRSSLFNNYNNIIGYLFQYHHTEQANKITEWLVEHFTTDDPLTVYRNTLIRSGYIPGMFGVNLVKNFARSNSGYFHVNLGLAKREQFFALAAHYEALAKEVKDPDERNYLLAMHYKRVAVLYHKYLFDRGLPIDQKQLDGWLDQAWTHFKLISEAHLAGEVAVNYRYYSDGVRTRKSPRKLVFLYPDYWDGWFANKFNSDVFIQYIIRNGLLKIYYSTPETIALIHDWISTAHEVFLDRDFSEGTGIFQNDYVVPDAVLTHILDHATRSPAGKAFDKNLPLLILANRHFDNGDTSQALGYYRLLEKDKLISSRGKYEYLSQTYFINSMMDLATHLAVLGHTKESLELIALYQPFEKAFFYTSCADGLYKTYQPAAFTFLDSAYTTVSRIDFNTLFSTPNYNELDSRRMLVYMLGKVGGEKANKLSASIIQELSETSRIGGVTNMITGTATDGNYFTALSIMPQDLTEDQELICYSSIIGQIARSQTEQSNWQGMDECLLWKFNYFLSPF
jgi:hypothetical protein